MIHLSPDAHLSLDLVSDVPKWVTFLIRQEYSKYSTKAGGFTFDLLQLGRFEVLLDPSLGHNTLLTSQYWNPVSRVWSLFRTIKGLTHFATSQFSHNHIGSFVPLSMSHIWSLLLYYLYNHLLDCFQLNF